MKPDRKQLSRQLKEAARLLDVLGEEPRRARAFDNAARQLEAYEGDVEQLFSENRLTDIKGVGQGIAAELATLKEQERIPLLESLYRQVPEGVRGLFKVSGLGAKKIAALWMSGVEDLSGLIAACQDGRVAALKGFGPKSAEKIGLAAEFALVSSRRMRLDQAEVYASALSEALLSALPEARVQLAGSLRRALETVGDIDLVLSGAPFDNVKTALEGVAQQVESAPPVLSAMFEGRPVELRVVRQDAWGAALTLHTGNDAYRQTLLEAAHERGYALGDDGLTRAGALIPTPEEEDLYARLELPFSPPERREWARPDPVDGLITLNDIRGVIHNHTTYSDGAHSLQEMVAEAEAQGYAYLGIADHSRTSAYAGGLSIAQVREQAAEMATIRQALRDSGSRFEVLHGMEVDILADGTLDYPDALLAELDYTVVSVHQHFELSQREQTERIVRAVQHPHAHILGHATGRLLLARPGYSVDLEAVIAACAESGTIIELNANPQRLDLDWRWVRRAKAQGCLFAINPDAHHKDGYQVMRYGVLMARKAGLGKGDVINTVERAEELLGALKRA